ncbi:M56 family metallopeptidase [Duganella sp. BuS-21]|uniref:M56 family metallopeptidase n=1 Tax=Duganella sp. BuS-21 TaxID=2943848 RepID=UPI0035A6C480
MESQLTTMLSALVPATGWALLHFLWQGLLIGWAVTLAMYLLRKARPQTRYAVACGGLLLCAVLPLSGILLQLAESRTVAGPIINVFSVGDGATWTSVLTESRTENTRLTALRDLLRRQLPWIVGLWLLGAALMALRLAIGLKWVADHTRVDEYTSNPYWQRRLSELARRFGIDTHVRLGVADKLDSPITAGCWKPIVLVPAALVTGMPADLLEALLAHELAHIKRNDYLVNLIQSAIEIVLFYHPSVWAISRRIRIEREQIADDLAVGMLGQPQKLAQALSQLDRFQFDTTQLAHAAHGGNLMSRIKRLLRPDVEPVSWKMALPLAGLLAAGAVLYAHAAPQLPEPPAPPQPPALIEPVAPAAAPAIPAAPARAAQAAPVAPIAPIAPIAPVALVAPVAMMAAAALPPVPAVPATPAQPVRVKFDHMTVNEGPNQRSAYAIVHGNKEAITVSASTKDIRKVSELRGAVKGDFLWFRDGDKTYVVQDPAVIARIDSAWAPVDSIGGQMDAQGKKMEAQGKIMNAIGEQMNTVGQHYGRQVERDMDVQQRQMELVARVQEKVARRMDLAARELQQDNSPEKLRAFQEKLNGLQAEMAPLQKQMAEYQRELAPKLAKLHEQNAPMKALQQKMAEASRPMGDLNVRMGELNLKHTEAVREAERVIKSLMQESLQNGKAVPAPSV